MNPAIQAFLIKLAIKLAIKFNNGPFHRHAAKRKKYIEQEEAKHDKK